MLKSIKYDLAIALPALVIASLIGAYSVAQYFESKRVNPVRLATAGKGEAEPVAPNASESGRQLNRRVEIYVEPVRES